METRVLRGGRLKQGTYDPGAQVMEIEFVDGTIRRFKAVPSEVWRRLLASPNPASYYEDRIEEEYAFERDRATGDAEARSKLDALFGSPPGKPAD
ncbi:MAG: KTSC domain-containing protein [Burkholderiaceae bacterium]|nr:KTSC domain-containing protein [Burkholderiaceae bacterium]